MSASEFTLIKDYFTQKQYCREDVLLGIGDDAAITRVPTNRDLVTTVDTLVEGTHFLPETSAFDIGFKSVAVNLSDIAAMGAHPAWACIALTLPDADDHWLAQFSEGVFTLLNKYDVQLIGGDTTRGPLSVSVQMMGFVPTGKAITRNAARPGDLIFVTGTLGDAGLGLLHAQGKQQLAKQYIEGVSTRLHRPVPRVEQGIALRDIANAMIDISDGLLSDLNHILENSRVGAKIFLNNIPLSSALLSLQEEFDRWALPLSSGDDYELCFTVSPEKKFDLEQATQAMGCPITCIGEIQSESGLHCLSSNGEKIVLPDSGFDHFGR